MKTAHFNNYTNYMASAFVAGCVFLNVFFYRVTIYNTLSIQSMTVLLGGVICFITIHPIVINKKILGLWLLFGTWIIVIDLLWNNAYEALIRDLIWLWLPALLLVFRRFYSFRNTILHYLKFVACFLVGHALFNILTQYDSGLHPHQLPVWWGYSRHLGMAAGWSVLLLYSPVANDLTNARWWKVLWRLFRVISLALVIWSGTRSALLGLLLAAGFMICLNPKTTIKTIVLDTFLAYALLLFMPNGPDGSFWRIFDRTIRFDSLDHLSSGRISIWLNTIKTLWDQGMLFTGAGGNGFMRLQQNFALIFNGSHVQPHNVVIQWLSDWGMIGCSFFILLHGYIFRSAFIFRSLGTNREFWSCALYVFAIAGTDAGLYQIEFITYAILAICLTLEPQEPASTNNQGAQRTIHWWWSAAIISLVVSLPGYYYRLNWLYYFPTY